MKRVLAVIASLAFAATGCASSTGSASSSSPSTAASSTLVVTATSGPATTASSTTSAAPTTTAVTTTTAAVTTTTAPVPKGGVPKPPAGYVQPAATSADCAPGGPGDNCYTATVPVDPTHPDAGSLKLAVVTRRADPATWTSPVLIFNQQAVSLTFGPPPAPTYFTGHDLVWVDGRGASRSDGAVDCSGLAKLPGQLGTANVAAPGLGVI